MRLNSKIALTLVVPMLILIGAFAWAIHNQVLSRFAALERTQQIQNHQRLLEAVNNDLTNISQVSSDWGAFNDSYSYMQGKNPHFIKANLVPASLNSLHVDGILLFDQHQQLRTQYGINHHTHALADQPPELLQRIATSLARQPLNSRLQGILIFQGKILALASSPITDSSARLPAIGSLVMFKYLDQDAIDSLAKRIKLSLQFHSLQSPGSETIAPEILKTLTHQPLLLQNIDNNMASSYSVFNDLDGHRALLMQVSMPRDTYREGMATVRELLAFTYLALLVFVVGTFFAIHSVALKRLSRLSQRLIAIGTTDGNKLRLPMQGHDEISHVARSVNAMLDKLEHGFEQRRSAVERQRELNALLVRIATDDAVAHGDTTALFNIMAGSLTAGTSLDAWSLWLSAEDGQSFDCLRASTGTAIGMSPEHLNSALTGRSAGLPSLLTCEFENPPGHGLILPFHIDSHIGALCVEAKNPDALSAPDELSFLIAATQLVERSLRTHFQNLREHDLRKRAEKDALTGMANRSLFEITLMQRLAELPTSERMIGLLFIDLDRFKAVNDTYGHDVGDWLLCQVAQRLHSHVRADDLVARLGGDEFTVILNSLHAVKDAEHIAEKILQELNKPFIHGEITLDCGASMGLAWAPAHGSSIAELVKAADMAMYTAKQRGRGNWQAAQGLH